ncbi:MAG: hypothetical protein IK132_03405, partial [Clostridia bacterium]|nr:hypothetical protein [Clostridia bacterium]
TLWRTDVIAYKPKKIASKVADFRMQDDGRIVYFCENRFRGVKVDGFGIDTLGSGSLWLTTGVTREKLWDASESIRWLGSCAVGQNTVFVTAMYVEQLWPNDYEYRETRIIKRELDGEYPETLYRRAYSMAEEEWRAHQVAIVQQYHEEGYWTVGNTFRYYAQKKE